MASGKGKKSEDWWTESKLYSRCTEKMYYYFWHCIHLVSAKGEKSEDKEEIWILQVSKGKINYHLQA